MSRLVLGSITHLKPGDRDRHVLVGSHGGIFTAAAAIDAGVASLICHNAGIGLDAAGIEGLSLLNAAGVPAAAVDFRSARIGDATDMLARGQISHVNEAGIACGVAPGMAVAQAFAKFEVSKRLPTPPGMLLGGRYREGRYPIAVALDRGSHPDVLAVDSASLILPDDADAIVVTGSHGGLPGGVAANAIKAQVRCAIFNDAGVGIDGAGIGRLPILEARGTAALTVAAQTARIGDALSTYETGIISYANWPAQGIGAVAGLSLRDFVRHLVNQSHCKEPQ